jgi:hypothetical protein
MKAKKKSGGSGIAAAMARSSSNKRNNNAPIYGIVAIIIIALAIWLAMTDSSTNTVSSSNNGKSSSSSPSAGVIRMVPMGFSNVTCETISAATLARDARAARKGQPKIATNNIAGCSPNGHNCGRWLEDDFITMEECDMLRTLGESAWSLTGGGNGGPSVLELQSGAVSQGSEFVDIYRLWSTLPMGIATPVSGPSIDAVRLYRNITQRIASRVRHIFGIVNNDTLWLTTPAFMSRINDVNAKTTHDEYWHYHIDRLQYGSFAYTALLYLNDYGSHYNGGRFIFSDDVPSINNDGSSSIPSLNGDISMVEPRCGRLNLFTSGRENIHRVERVTKGTRYALTIAFTCDPSAAVHHLWPKLNEQAYDAAIDAALVRND